MVAGVYIDEFLPYLRSTQTGEMVPTEVIRLKRKCFLRKYNFDTGWCFNWGEMENDDEIYALVIEGTFDIQGLVAIRKDDEKKAVYISWMCTGPENNKDLTKKVKHLGVGGLLFTIAANKSIECGYNGVMYGEVGNRELNCTPCQGHFEIV